MSSYRVDDHGIRVPRDGSGTLWVSFGGVHAWSLTLPRDASLTARGRRVRWPEQLASRLKGTTTVTIDGEDGEVYAGTVRFGSSDEPFVLQDKLGHQLFVNAAGHVSRSFADTDTDTRALVVDATRRALDDLRDGGFDAHLSYGCLLGAVRDGQMIGHDSDADVAYISPFTTPAQVIAESFEMERHLRRRGWRVIRMSGADLKLAQKLPDGRRVYVDVFGGFHVGDTFYLLGGRSGHLPRAALTPVAPVTLEGVELPGPADPEAVLAFLYGPSWRTPDPAFQNDDPIEGLRRIAGWLRGVRDNAVEWNDFYRQRRDEIPRGPSDFAPWVHEQVPAGTTLADLASGTGRDVVWWTQQGHEVLAYEHVGAARDQTRRRLRKAGATPPVSRALALNDRRSMLIAGAELARTPQPVTLVARGLVGSLNDEALDHLWVLAGMALRRGGALLLEFEAGRGKGSGPGKLTRRTRVEDVVAGIEGRGGVVQSATVAAGTDFFGKPDRRIARVVARWSTEPDEPNREAAR